MLQQIYSIQGYRYLNVYVEGDSVYYQMADGANSKRYERIDIRNLYSFYNGGVITTTEARRHGLSSKQSPAVAIIKAITQE